MTDNVIEIQHLSRNFGNKPALRDVSFSIPRGTVFGLVGENGAGKTTLLRHILGLLKAPAPAVRIFGLDPAKEPENVLSRIGYLSEDRDLPEWMQIDQLIGYRAAFYPHWDHAYAQELVDTFELPLKQRIKTLSRGQLARVGLLLAVSHRPELLVLDEPSSGLDPVVRRDILAAIIRTVADEGRTVLFSSHLLDEVQRVSDHVAMLHHGKLLLCDELNNVMNQHSRCTFRLPQSRAQPEVISGAIPGTISCNRHAAEWTVVCNGQRSAFDLWLHESGAEIVDETSPSLEEIFVARSSFRTPSDA